MANGRKKEVRRMEKVCNPSPESMEMREFHIRTLTWIYRLVVLGVFVWILTNQISNQGIGRYQFLGGRVIFDTKTAEFTKVNHIP
jgi:hypothetical protein